jgi:nitric oxide dioxygenase
MAATITQADTHYTNTVKTLIEYPETGILSKIFVKDAHTQQNLFCLTAGTTLEEHTSPKNATVMVIEGEGKLTLNGEEITLTQGVVVYMPTHAPHALTATNNLAFWLILSESEQSINGGEHKK